MAGVVSIENLFLPMEGCTHACNRMHYLFPTSQILFKSRVYVDGSSVKAKNGYRVGGAGVFWGDEDPRNLAHPILSVRDEEGRNIEVTNNRAELVAALMAVQRVRTEV